MKRLLSLLLGISALALGQIPAKDRMVIVISLDGFPAYTLENPKTAVPTLRKLISSGVTSRMTTINPTVTWPNHTTMITGVRADEHGLLINGSLVRTGSWPPVKGEPMIEKEKMVHAPTVYDAAHKAGLTTGQVDWVAIEKAPGITWPFAEWASPEGAVEQEMIRKGVVAESDLKDFTRHNILWRDQIWSKAAAFLIKEHKPNLLLVHFLSLDSTHHRYGPNTLAADDAIAFLDSCVERIVNAVHDAGMDDKTTFLIVSDHGFKAYTKQIKPAVALAAAGLGDKSYVLPEGGSAFVYLASPDLQSKAVEALKPIEGIDQVITSDGFAAAGLPSPDRDPQMSAIFLTAKTNYAFSGAKGGPVTAEVPQVGGGHGYFNGDPEMDAIFIASGYGIRPGTAPARIANIDVAPTIARLLGVSLPSAKGKPVPVLR